LVALLASQPDGLLFELLRIILPDTHATGGLVVRVVKVCFSNPPRLPGEYNSLHQLPPHHAHIAGLSAIVN
jgi:hypothetical protein